MPRGIQKKYGIGAMPSPILFNADPEGGGGKPSDPAPEGDPKADTGRAGGDDSLKADLARERDKRQELERTIQSIQESQTQQRDALAAALGLKPDEASDAEKIAGQVTGLSERLDKLTRDNLELTVLSAHPDLSDDDKKVIKSIQDEATMRAVAARLQEAAKAAAPSGKPKADPPSSGGGAPKDPVDQPGLPRLRAAYETAETP